MLRTSHTVPRAGIALTLGCLLLLGLMPVIVNGRPGGTSAVTFALALSVWQLLFSLPLQLREWRSGERGVFRESMGRAGTRRVLAIALFTGLLFAISTWAYVLAFDTTGAINAAIALQAYPLFATALEAAFLRRDKSRTELGFTGLIVVALYYLATGGTWRMAGLSPWFAVALAVPALWSIAHVVLKEVLVTTPITPNQVTTSRLAISVLCLFPLAIVVDGPSEVAHAATSMGLQSFAMMLGLAYYVELVLWFNAVRHIDVSVASTITVPAPAVTMLLMVLLLDEPAHRFQFVALALVAVGLVGLLHAGSRRRVAEPITSMPAGS